jgi:hypothetical protein
MKNSRIILLAFLSVLLAMFLTACGEGSVDSSNEAQGAEFVEELINLDDQVVREQISNEEFLIQFNNILKKIDNTPKGTELFKDYLEENILGYSFTSSALKNRKTGSDILNIIDDIEKYLNYHTMESFLNAVIFCLVPEPASSMLQVAQPDIFISLASILVRFHINKAMISNPKQIDSFKAQDLINVLRTNPFEAERQLLTALGKPIPSWLKPAPSGSLRNDTGIGTYTGSFSGSGPFANTLDDCTFQVDISGDITITLYQVSSMVKGSVQVSGCWLSTVTGGGNCIPSGAPFTNTLTVSGTTSNLYFSGGDFPILSFQGIISTTINGTVTFTFPNTTGSISSTVILTKQ